MRCILSLSHSNSNTQSHLPDLYKDLNVSERVRQTVLTDSEDETDEMAAESTSGMIRGTIRQREKEVSDLKDRLAEAKGYKSFVVDAQGKRKRPLDDKERRDALKRVAEHPYKPRSYSNEDDSLPDLSGEGNLAGGQGQVGHIDKDGFWQIGRGLLDDINPFHKTTAADVMNRQQAIEKNPNSIRRLL